MYWPFSSRDELPLRGAIMRAIHERWLTKALRSEKALPRIPTRAVREGGFSILMSQSAGRKWAEDWWAMTLDNPDLADE
jgi:hypothetical protein